MADKENTKTTEDEKEEKTEEVVEGEATADEVVVEGENVVEEEKRNDSEETELRDEDVEENIEGDAEEIEDVEAGDSGSVQKDTPDFKVGDTIRVEYKIIEGDKTRTQPYQGIVISKKGEGLSKTFTVRKIGADNIGVERIFPLFSPNIEKIKILKRGKVRRAKLYYLRGRVGRKATRIKEKITVDK